MTNSSQPVSQPPSPTQPAEAPWIWIKAINRELANLRDWANENARRANKTEAELAALRSVPGSHTASRTADARAISSEIPRTLRNSRAAIQLHNEEGICKAVDGCSRKQSQPDDRSLRRDITQLGSLAFCSTRRKRNRC